MFEALFLGTGRRSGRSAPESSPQAIREQAHYGQTEAGGGFEQAYELAFADLSGSTEGWGDGVDDAWLAVDDAHLAEHGARLADT